MAFSGRAEIELHANPFIIEFGYSGRKRGYVFIVSRETIFSVEVNVGGDGFDVDLRFWGCRWRRFDNGTDSRLE